MTATATEYGAEVAKRLWWAERLLSAHARWSFFARVQLEAESLVVREFAQVAAAAKCKAEIEFWNVAVRAGIRVGQVSSVELVTAARAYVAEYRQ